MKKKSFLVAKDLAILLPKYFSHESYIFRRDPILMLRGFALDMPPGACYVWKFYFPLIINSEFINLNIGYRVPKGYIETSGKTINEVAILAADLISKNDDFSDEESINDLLSFVRDVRISSDVRTELYEALNACESVSPENLIRSAETELDKLGLL